VKNENERPLEGKGSVGELRVCHAQLGAGRKKGPSQTKKNVRRKRTNIIKRRR